MSTPARIGVLTGGGDAPGLNAVIRAVVKAAATVDMEIVGLEDSFDGLMAADKSRVLTPADVTGILRLGGTILGTRRGGDLTSTVDGASARFKALALDGLICIGGDGTLTIAHELHKRGLPIVAVPKTIDNDIAGTNSCFGFDTAVSFATEAIDRLHTTAHAHHRIMVVEVMGRYTGWIALHAGVAGGADVVLIPEIPFDLASVAACIRDREAGGARFSIVVVAEGAHARGGRRSLVAEASEHQAERLGGVADDIACQLTRLTGKETRAVVLGHLQRGGAPTAFDRTLATRFGGAAIELLRCKRFGVMVANHPPNVVPVPLADVVGRKKPVPLDYDLLQTARSLGISFGD